jgi:hypothetical protein
LTREFQKITVGFWMIDAVETMVDLIISMGVVGC